MPDTGTNKLGKYEIIREIGRSNDIVYEAIDPSIGRRVALKELLMNENLQGAQRRERIDRFRREGRAAGRLSHPNIVTVYEVGIENDRYFIAMELLEGQSLRDALRVRGALPINDAVDFTIQLCDALSYAHKQGVIHRDIKPDNVQILPGNHIKLTDFGIARLVGETNLTQDGQVFGTPSYMSPEQIGGKPLDARSDIFSLGVLLYEMATGSKPFTGDNVVSITYSIMNSDPLIPPSIPPFVASAIRKALQKNPDDRYQDIEQMAIDLREQKVDQYAQPFQAQPQMPDQQVNLPWSQSGQPGYQSQPPAPGKYTPSSPGWTPYGTPMPQYDNAPPPQPAYDQPVHVPQPLISAPTRSFLGLVLMVVGLIGLAAFFGWSIQRAYTNYQEQHSDKAADRYFQQGTKLYANRNYEGAIKQWKLVIETNPSSRRAMMADEYIYRTIVQIGVEAVQKNDYDLVHQTGQRLLQLRKDSTEGYYFLGINAEHNQDYKSAREYFTLAVRFNAGGDSEPFADSAAQKLASYIPGYTPSTPQSAPNYIPPSTEQ